MRISVLGRVLLAPVLAAMALSTAQAGDDLRAGDGSGTNNPDLLRKGPGECSNCTSGPPHEWSAPFFDIDWALGLRGSYLLSTTGESFRGSVLPSLLLTHQGLRTDLSIAASAELTQSSLHDFRIAAAALDAVGSYELDENTNLTGAGSLRITQDAPGPGMLASSQVISADGEVGLTHQLGDFDLALRGTVGRDMYSPSVNGMGISIDNSWQNNSSVGGGLRVAYPVSPLLAVFIDADATYQMFDGPSPVLLAKLDGPSYTAKAGLTYELDTTLSAEAWAGLGLRRYDAGFPEVVGTLYGARVTFRPDETLVLNASLDSAINPPASADVGFARITYTATADGRYIVNPWVALRASAQWTQSHLIGTPDVLNGYTLGVGADYSLTGRTTFTADYAFSHQEYVPPTAPVDSHKFTLGVTLSN